MWTRCQLA
jgi:hypothetical protein